MTNNTKTKMVMNIFNSVHKKYDLMNDLMSFASHRLWKNKMVSMMNNFGIGDKIIDVACGTCDISYRITKRFPGTEIFSCDINENMLMEGRDRLINSNITTANFVCCNAESLPFPDKTFSCYVIVFGIRNVQNRKKALSEAFRVLKDGGQFICMEFSPVNENSCSLLKTAYDFYSLKIIPNVGLFTTGSKDAYTYLVNSIREFPDGDTFKEEISSAMFSDIKQTDIMNGIVKIHIAWKPASNSIA